LLFIISYYTEKILLVKEVFMKRFLVLFALLILITAGAFAQSAATRNAAAELSFSFTRQRGFSTNQFAVWVEDVQGRYVKTLYATRYTANGGYKRRETSIPLWVKQSGLSGLTQAQVDSFSSATPRNGALNYIWDGTDSRNAPIPPGDYVIWLEGTLRGANQVYYSAPIKIGGGAATAIVKTEYVGNAAAESAMINNVTVRVLR
jgi:hypothetical protein